MENSYLCSKIDSTDVMYSSDDINFRSQPMTVEKLLCGLRDNHIEDFTVRKFVNELFVNRSASYVESVMIGLPLLPIVFDGSVTPWYVIDGVKRLAALLAFANNKYPLGESSYSRIPRFQYFDEMSFILRNRFLRAQIPCYVINPGTPREIIEDIEERIKRSL